MNRSDSKYIQIVLGGTTAAYNGDVGLPGIRGRPGGKNLYYNLYDRNLFFIFI